MIWETEGGSRSVHTGKGSSESRLREVALEISREDLIRAAYIALPMISVIQPHFKTLGAELLGIIALKRVCVKNRWLLQRSNQRNTT